MTDKRFRFNGRTNCIEYDNKSILLDSYGEDIEELLNELHEENQDLHKKEVELGQNYLRLLEENERLKSDLTHTKVLYHSLQDTYSGLLKLVHGFKGDVE